MANPGEYKTSRRHRRTQLSILVQYRFHPYEDFLYEYTTDVSPGGVFLRAEVVQEVGSTVYLQFSPRDGSVLIEAVGRVAHVVRPGQGPDPGMGVEFVNMDAPTREHIRVLCEEPVRGRARR